MDQSGHGKDVTKQMETQKEFRSLIDGCCMRAALIPAVLIGVTLMILVFVISHYVSQRHTHAIEDEFKEYSKELLAREASSISAHLDSIEDVATLLQDAHVQLLSGREEATLPKVRPTFAKSEHGLFYRRDVDRSSLLYRSAMDLTDRQLRKALITEAMDPLFESIVAHYPGIVAAYFNSWDDLQRRVPPDLRALSDPGLLVPNEEKRVYYLADPVHDPQKKAVWADIRQDEEGAKDVLSCLVPIYVGEFLEGVTGLDVTLGSIVNDPFSYRPLWGAVLLLADAQGEVLAISEHAGLPSVPPYPKRTEFEEVVKDIFAGKEMDGLDGSGHLFDIASASEEGVLEVTRRNTTFMVTHHEVGSMGWELLLMVEKGRLFKTTDRVERHAYSAGLVALLLILLVYLLFYFFLRKRAHRLAMQVTTPLEKLSQKTAKIGSAKMDIQVVHSHILEIDRLNQGFVKMVEELEIRTTQMLAIEIEEKIRQREVSLYHECTMTDPMTGLYDRHKAVEVLNAEIERFKRYGHPLSLIIIDIDHFKHINDTYGHKTGDRLLIDLSTLIKTHLRITDITARLGGEEFLVITTGTGLEAASMLAEKLRKTVEERRSASNHHLTISLGVTSHHKGESATQMTDRVKQALLQAKEAGRNRVVTLS